MKPSQIQSSKDIFTLNNVPPSHPFLLPMQLRQESEAYLREFINILFQNMSSYVASMISSILTITIILISHHSQCITHNVAFRTTAIVILNSLSAIAKQRSLFVSLIVQSMLDYLKKDQSHLTETQLKSLQHALKTAFAAIMKYIISPTSQTRNRNNITNDR